MSFGFEHFPYILEEKDRNLYNIFFAGLSIIFANSITISFLLRRPEKGLSRLNPKRKRILNDQFFLSFNFSYWFTKMGLVFFVFSMCCMDFDFSPYLVFVSTLLLLVLYLESWKSLSMVFRKNRLKYQFLHFMTIVFLTFVLSRFDIINYKAIDEISIKSNPKYDLPYSNFYSPVNNMRYNLDLNFKIESNKSDEIRIKVYDKWVSITEIPSIVASERASIREEMVPYLSISITADKNIDLKYIKLIEAQLYTVNQYRILYDVYNEDLLSARFERRGINYKIVRPVYNFEVNKSILIPPPLPPIDEYYFSDTLQVSINNQIKLNGTSISKEMLVRKMKNHINKNTLFLYSYNENTKYQDYITVLAAHNIAVNELRTKEQTTISKYDSEYDKLSREEKWRLIEKYPKYIIEKFN